MYRLYTYSNVFAECGNIEGTISLPTEVSANIKSDCTTVMFCANMGYISRNIQGTIKLDPCSYEITVGLESMEATESLLVFNWGKSQSFALQGGIRME